MKGQSKRRRSPSERTVMQQMLKRLKRTPLARKKVRRVREKVQSECYENDLKLTVAIDRMLRDMSGED